MSAGNTEASRAAFEAYAVSRNVDLHADDVEGMAYKTKLAWFYWQASRKAALNEAIARVAQCMGPRSGAETAIKELLK